MIRIVISILLLFFALGCGVVKKKTSYGKERRVTVEASDKEVVETPDTDTENTHIPEVRSLDKADNIINTAMTFTGVRYKYGGANRKGMDCSGLLYIAFGEHDVSLPRISYQMANEGRRIKVNKVAKGDLLFFKTSKKGKRINHVGLVVAVEEDEIKFIHSTSSRGVIVSSLREGFWNYAFVKATRVL